MLDDVLLYSLSSDEALGSEINSQLFRLEQQAKAEGSGAKDIELAIAHTRVILEYKPQIDRLTRDILKLPTLDAIRSLESAYSLKYQSAVRLAGLFRLLAVCLFIGALGGFVYLMLRQQLRASQRTSGILSSITDAFVALESAVAGHFR